MVMRLYKEKCHFQSERGCKALTEMLCKSGRCSFYKTERQYQEDLIKYPPFNYAAYYEKKHKNDNLKGNENG